MKMEMKRSKWHYRWANPDGKFDEKYNDSLCKYVWRCIGHIIEKLLQGCMIGLAIFLILMTLYTYTQWTFAIPVTILILFILGSVFLPIWVIFYIREVKGVNLELPGENIVVEYIKAKYRGICPLIKYVD